MAKPPRKRRMVQQYVTSFRDRHGKLRYRYRRKGYRSEYFKSEFGTDEFRAEYARFQTQVVGEAVSIDGRDPPGTIGDLISRYVANPARLGPSRVTQVKVRRILDRFRSRYASGPSGYRYVRDFSFENIDKVLELERVKQIEGKRMVGGVEAARKLRKELVRLFDYAEKIGMRTVGSNPVRLAEQIRVSPVERSKGHHTWTEAEIAQYRGKHALGTMARLALELLLWTGQRRGDGYLFGPGDIRDGQFQFTQGKGGKEMWLPVAPPLLAAITATARPASATTFLVSELGKPYSYGSFGNKMRDWCDRAGLPHCSAHGLRKANARRLANLGMSNQTLKAVGGWTNDREVALYTAAADQTRLAAAAIAEMARWEATLLSNPESLTDDENDGKARND